MSAVQLAALIISVLLVIFLVYAMLFPERL
ncbi:K(+)-transporting ATPase subunit F [Acidimicrobiaceae bacterium USS-CC1]|uniref:K(+)-transporting ATPase subunit F n=1 Tax=Acidiferrimicrobium australe TaxID=2664430 RepID=A0ABW9QQ04_9ACTN|nr:K(+)-transporting ATPase subunit F [Acidiferrimicrobium australe]